jgi:hypothetical protein
MYIAARSEPGDAPLTKELDSTFVTGHNYGMGVSKYRTSFALDPDTVRLLQSLAERWRVSQAEVVRRAIRTAAQIDSSDSDGLEKRLTRYREAGRLTAEVAEDYLGELTADRGAWQRGPNS